MWEGRGWCHAGRVEVDEDYEKYLSAPFQLLLILPFQLSQVSLANSYGGPSVCQELSWDHDHEQCRHPLCPNRIWRWSVGGEHNLAKPDGDISQYLAVLLKYQFGTRFSHVVNNKKIYSIFLSGIKYFHPQSHEMTIGRIWNGPRIWSLSCLHLNVPSSPHLLELFHHSYMFIVFPGWYWAILFLI